MITYIGILVVIAIPAYNDHIAKSKGNTNLYSPKSKHGKAWVHQAGQVSY
jgi:Tfp pilus assembly protein PilE